MSNLRNNLEQILINNGVNEQEVLDSILEEILPLVKSNEEADQLCRNAMFNGELFGRNVERKKIGLGYSLPLGETFEEVYEHWEIDKLDNNQKHGS